MLYGLDGADHLYGGEGLDYLFGGTGSDVFHFDGNAIFNENGLIDDTDIIRDWGTGGAADSLSIENMLSGYDPLSSTLSDFVQATDTGSDVIIKIDRDGSATNYDWQDLVRVEGQAGLDLQVLLSNGQMSVV
ncbi:MAG: type I secretion C-terminal target domain-containing protein [Alphaproteobacteria bacterium]|nr:type I secretion C-terminal target domain-containing protein [Alphaproteobacteria bacterium]